VFFLLPMNDWIYKIDMLLELSCRFCKFWNLFEKIWKYVCNIHLNNIRKISTDV